MARRYKLRPASRLRRNADFLEVRDAGKPYRCAYFALFTRIRANDSADISSPRIGISASRRVGNSPQRNLLKRRFREIFRLFKHEINADADIVISLRLPASRATYAALEQRFLHALKYKRLLHTTPPPTSSNPNAQSPSKD